MARQRSTPVTPEASVDVRRAVLDGALDIIATEGAEAVSMREVARRAGVSHQAPYHYFGDRAGIFAAISQEGFRSFTEEFRRALDIPGNIAANCLRAYVSFAIAHKGHYRVMFRSDICGIHTHEDTMSAADEAFLCLLDLAEAVDPERDPADAMTLPIALWAQAHGLATLIIDSPLLDKLPPETNLDELINKVSQLTTWSKQ
ncbi:MAG: TetR/AcrR family transcriptional regulator [Ilumatobacteraceae bacterium]